MKYLARAGTGDIQIELEREDHGGVRARIEDREYRLRIPEVEPGVFRIEREGRTLEFEVTRVAGGYDVRLGRNRLQVEILDRRAVLARNPAAGPAGRNEIRAPMPGRVVRVLVSEGAAVRADTGLIVVEAMKMQNEVRAPGPGTVERIAVSEGQAVNAGDLLIVVA